MTNKKTLIFTFSIASILFLSCIFLMIIFNNSLFGNHDLSGDIRNAVLSTIAITSIPFLIFNYINKQNDIDIKRNDIDIKQNDQLFKIESSITDKIYVHIEASLINYKKAINEMDFTINNGNGGAYVWMDQMLYNRDPSNTMSFDNHSLSKVQSQDSWVFVKQEIASICGLLKMSKELKNSKFHELILHKFGSILSNLDIAVFYYLTVILEVDNQEKVYSFKLETLSDIIADLENLDLVPESLMDKIETIESRSETFA